MCWFRMCNVLSRIIPPNELWLTCVCALAEMSNRRGSVVAHWVASLCCRTGPPKNNGESMPVIVCSLRKMWTRWDMDVVQNLGAPSRAMTSKTIRGSVAIKGVFDSVKRSVRSPYGATVPVEVGISSITGLW